MVIVTPLVGVWIEICHSFYNCHSYTVTPLVGVWIEMSRNTPFMQLLPSLPLWECGLKSLYSSFNISFCLWSLPLWECGLKSCYSPLSLSSVKSLPLWECGLKSVSHSAFYASNGHSPCGSVD